MNKKSFLILSLVVLLFAMNVGIFLVFSHKTKALNEQIADLHNNMKNPSIDQIIVGEHGLSFVNEEGSLLAEIIQSEFEGGLFRIFNDLEQPVVLLDSFLIGGRLQLMNDSGQAIVSSHAAPFDTGVVYISNKLGNIISLLGGNHLGGVVQLNDINGNYTGGISSGINGARLRVIHNNENFTVPEFENGIFDEE